MTTNTATRTQRNWHHEAHLDAKGKPTGAITIGASACSSHERRVTMINPTGRGNPKGSPSWVLWFGAYGCTALHVYSATLDDALDECVDWLSDHSPGLLADDQVVNEYKRLLAERVAVGASPDDEMVIEGCQDAAEVDTTIAGNAGNYLNSSEWGIGLENPTSAELYRYITDHP